jgi:hypothetical protein
MITTIISIIFALIIVWSYLTFYRGKPPKKQLSAIGALTYNAQIISLHNKFMADVTAIKVNGSPDTVSLRIALHVEEITEILDSKNIFVFRRHLINHLLEEVSNIY